jgi:hypothetical protein
MSNDHHPYAKRHQGDPQYVTDQYARKLLLYRQSILLMIKDFWGLVPQPVKPEYKKRWDEVWRSSGETWERLKEEVGAEWFGDIDYIGEYGETYWKWYDFEKGKHITWQQTLVLMGIEKAVQGKGKLPRHFSTKSGHGIGKSAMTAWIVIWFLYCYFMSQVAFTAPTAGQMHDVLWKELAIWINRIKDETVKEVFNWQHDYIRIRYEEESWFARAKTSTKENTEALAGVHADHVLIGADEASGVADQIYNTAEGALTSGNVFVFLISNPTKTSGYFFDSHNKNRSDWQRFTFNCEESPVVDRGYVKRQAKRHGVNSDEYRIRVKGIFPSEDAMDEKGYMQLIPRSRIITAPSLGVDDVFIGRKRLGIDPSGDGSDSTEFCIRDDFRAKIVKTLLSTNDKEIALWTIKIATQYNLSSKDIAMEGFGNGAAAARHVVLNSKGKLAPYVVLPGSAPEYESSINSEFFNRWPDEVDEDDRDLYLNIRAVMHVRMRTWLLGGGMLLDPNPNQSDWVEEISSNKIRRPMHGNKSQMMSKVEMAKLMIPSPNKSDALALTFLLDDPPATKSVEERRAEQAYMRQAVEDSGDPFGVL